jgi:hypothetical protein
MKFYKTFTLAREESFNIDQPEVFALGISSEVTIIESIDGKTHIKMFAASKKAAELAKLVEIVETDGKLVVRMEKKLNRKPSLSLDIKDQKFFGLSFGSLHDLSIEIALPKTSNLNIKTVSGDIEVNQIVSNLDIGTVSGDVKINQNPINNCSVKTVSGDITTHTFSDCVYTLKTISGDIKVYLAPNLEVEVDGVSISGDLNSEIPLDADESSVSDKLKLVNITASTISGDITLARN